MFLTAGLKKKMSRKQRLQQLKHSFEFLMHKESHSHHEVGLKTAPRRKTPLAAILNACTSLARSRGPICSCTPLTTYKDFTTQIVIGEKCLTAWPISKHVRKDNSSMIQSQTRRTRSDSWHGLRIRHAGSMQDIRFFGSCFTRREKPVFLGW